jgi:ribosome-interacting GTPase 1
MVDAQKPEQLDAILNELYGANFRINQKPPDIRIKKTGIGGIKMDKASKSRMSKDLVVAALGEFGIHNAEISIREQITFDQFIDVVEGNRKYVPAIIALNKIDSVPKIPNLKEKYIKLSAKDKLGIEEVRTQIFEKLGFIRIYMKRPGEKPDFDEPLLMRKGCTVEEVCKTLHKGMLESFRYAQISGPSAKFAEQKVGLKHVLKDEDILNLVIKR